MKQLINACRSVYIAEEGGWVTKTFTIVFDSDELPVKLFTAAVKQPRGAVYLGGALRVNHVKSEVKP